MSYSKIILVAAVFGIIVIGVIITLTVLVIRALLKYLKSKNVRTETAKTRASLSEVLKEQRGRHRMTQEFVAESLGVSRQAVSKWENGTSDPSTGNLISLAKLYGISTGDLLREVEVSSRDEKKDAAESSRNKR